MAGMSWTDYANRPKGGSKFLNTWKKNGKIVIYLHTNSMLLGRFQHLIPYVGENDKGKETIRFFTYICAEDYNQQANNRDHIPSKCPLCLFAHYLRENNDIADNETVWDASIGSKLDRIITKADYIGEGDWRNSFMPRHQAVFGVIDVEDLDGGLKTMIEPISLADSISKAITQSIISDGEDGDPAINPYAIMLQYDENAVKKTDYYTAFRYNQYKPNGEDKARIEELLASEDMNLITHTKPRNTKELLAIMKKMITVDVDFDLIGGSSDDDEEEETKASKKTTTEKKTTRTNKKTKKPEPEPEDDDDDDVVEDEEDEEEIIEATLVDCEDCKGKGFKIKKSKKTGKKVKVKCKTCDGTGKVESEEDEEEMSKCPACGAVIPDSAEECPKCGAEFDDDEEDDDDD